MELFHVYTNSVEASTHISAMFSYWEETVRGKLGPKRSTTMISSLPNTERFLHLTHANPIHFVPHRITLLVVYLGSS